MLVCVLVIVRPRILGTDILIDTGTNVAKVSMVVTHGTNHTFYYRGHVAWEWDQLCTRLGLGMRADGTKLVSSSPEPIDMMWLTIRHRGRLPKPADIRGWEAKAGVGRREFRGEDTGQALICDEKRGVSVYWWLLSGGIEKHGGSTIHVVDRSSGEEFASIRIR